MPLDRFLASELITDAHRREALEELYLYEESHDVTRVRLLLARHGKAWLEQTIADLERLKSVEGES